MKNLDKVYSILTKKFNEGYTDEEITIVIKNLTPIVAFLKQFGPIYTLVKSDLQVNLEAFENFRAAREFDKSHKK